MRFLIRLMLVLALLKMFAPGLADQTYQLLSTILNVANDVASHTSVDARDWTFE